MLTNYFITALRNLWRQKASTAINISGLVLGIATSLILFMLVRKQTSYDRFHTNFERIYRVVMEADGNSGKNYSSGVPPVLWEAFKNDFPEATEVVFTSYHGAGSLVTVQTVQGELKKFDTDNNLVFTQPAFFRIFDRKILMGNSANLLRAPNEAVISKSTAMKLFQKEDPLGEVITFNGKDYKVAAIMEDYQDNTDFPFNIMLSYSTIKSEKDQAGWYSIWSDEHVYFLLREGVSIEQVESRFPEFYKKYRGEDNPDHVAFHAQPLASIHHDSKYGNYSYSTISNSQILVLKVIGVLLIITACINFVNLVTAEAIKRSKEVGIRKTLGSSRGQLILQFLGESALITIIAVVLAIGLAQLGLPSINSFLKTTLSVQFGDTALWLFLAIVTVLVALLSGLYPAFVVSAFKPVFALKNSTGNRVGSGYTLRRVLVVVQFWISQTAIICTLVVISQHEYLSKKDLGFAREAIVNVPIPEYVRSGFSDGTSKMRTLRDELIRMPGVERASLCNFPPSSGNVMTSNFHIEGREKDFDAQMKMVDGNYLNLYELKLVAGKNILDLDTAQGFLVNEQLAVMLGYSNPQDIVGKRLSQGGRNPALPIVGVVANFHTMSLREPIEATVLYNRARNYSTVSLKVKLSQLQETILDVQQKWEAAYPEHVFSYKFLDDEVREFYDGEKRMSTLIIIFTGIAILIGCLGLFGLAIFMANQKTKEVGVRKVLGASAPDIMLMFSKEFLVLISLSFVMAVPFAWYGTREWLNNFSYKIDLGAATFLAGFVITICIAVLTVGYRSFKAAVVNPIESLRSE